MNQGFINITSWRVRTFLTNVALIITIKTDKIRAFMSEMPTAITFMAPLELTSVKQTRKQHRKNHQTNHPKILT